MKTVRTCKRALVAAVLLLAFGTGSVRAELIAYDQFYDYTAGGLSGQGQGFGWGTNNWSGSAAVTVSNAGNLSHGTIPSAGGGASTGTNTENSSWVGCNRTLATAITNSGTYYLGYLIQQEDPQAYHNYASMNPSSGSSWVAGGSWNSSGNWQLIRNNNNNYQSVNTGIPETFAVTHIVLKLVFDSSKGSLDVDMYVDPADASALASGGNATYTFGGGWVDMSKVGVTRYISGSSTGNMAFDEIRVGTTPEDMFDPIYWTPEATVFRFH